MNEQPKLIDVSVSPLPEPQPPMKVYYMVAAYNPNWGWKVYPDLWLTEEAAAKEAGKMTNHRKHHKILRVVLQ